MAITPYMLRPVQVSPPADVCHYRLWRSWKFSNSLHTIAFNYFHQDGMQHLTIRGFKEIRHFRNTNYKTGHEAKLIDLCSPQDVKADHFGSRSLPMIYLAPGLGKFSCQVKRRQCIIIPCLRALPLTFITDGFDVHIRSRWHVVMLTSVSPDCGAGHGEIRHRDRDYISSYIVTHNLSAFGTRSRNIGCLFCTAGQSATGGSVWFVRQTRTVRLLNHT